MKGLQVVVPGAVLVGFAISFKQLLASARWPHQPVRMYCQQDAVDSTAVGIS